MVIQQRRGIAPVAATIVLGLVPLSLTSCSSSLPRPVRKVIAGNSDTGSSSAPTSSPTSDPSYPTSDPSGPKPGAQGPAPRVSSTTAERLASAIVFDHGTKHLLPPQSVPDAVVPSSVALHPTDSAGFLVPPILPLSYTPRVLLASYTDDVMANVDAANKPTAQLYNTRLVWAVIWDNVSVDDVQAGGSTAKNGTVAPQGSSAKYFVVQLVDAISGQPLLISETPMGG